MEANHFAGLTIQLTPTSDTPKATRGTPSSGLLLILSVLKNQKQHTKRTHPVPFTDRL